MKKILILLATHAVAVLVGFAAGIYLLPILTAPPPPTASELEATVKQARFSGEFQRDLQDSDALHWGDGEVFVGRKSIALDGEVSPGPAYKLYLSREFVETEADFLRLKPGMALVGDVRTFRNFVVPVPDGIDPAEFNTVIVWCEAFDQFITAARYQ